ncbi:MAG: hypothetical protein JNK09_12000 [Prolixibacteraceae bacterium]|nr:hypothetical protein [Prolixibacteraceae bacterium]
MKTLVLAIAVMASISLSAQTKKEKLYPFKTAVIEYTYEGNSTGTQTLYIDNYGWSQCKIEQTSSKAFGQKSETNKAEITKDFDIYSWDLKTKEGVKLRNTLAEDLMNDPDFDPEEFGKKTMDMLGFKKTGNETINGKVCEVWKGLGGSSTIWMWNSLAMKSEVKMLGTKTIWTATTIKINEGVPAGKFVIPSDIKFADGGTTDPIEMMNKGMKQAEEEEGKQSGDTQKSEEAPIKSLKDLKGFLKKIKTE